MFLISMFSTVIWTVKIEQRKSYFIRKETKNGLYE